MISISFDTNWPVQPRAQKKAQRSLIFWMLEEVRDSTLSVAKTKVLISYIYAYTGKLICAFAFAYADCFVLIFSYVAAHINQSLP